VPSTTDEKLNRRAERKACVERNIRPQTPRVCVAKPDSRSLAPCPAPRPRESHSQKQLFTSCMVCSLTAKFEAHQSPKVHSRHASGLAFFRGAVGILTELLSRINARGLVFRSRRLVEQNSVSSDPHLFTYGLMRADSVLAVSFDKGNTSVHHCSLSWVVKVDGCGRAMRPPRAPSPQHSDRGPENREPSLLTPRVCSIFSDTPCGTGEYRPSLRAT